MARQYSPKSFLRRAPNALLRRYLSERGVGEDLPWDHLAERDVDLIARAIEAAPEAVQREVDRDFRDIEAMADEGGTKTIIQEGRDSPYHPAELAAPLGSMSSHVARAFWTFLEHPEIFRVARRFHYADSLPRWRKRDGLPEVEADLTEEAGKRLAKAISEYYRREEGRGHACQVDRFRREGRLYWFAYPEDYAESRLVYDEKHRLTPVTQRPAFEVIYVYSPKEHSLDVNCRGSRRTLVELRRIFGRTILGIEVDETDIPGVVYELNGLLDPRFPLVLEPGDGVQEVRLRSLRVRILGQGNRRITLEVKPEVDPHGVHDLLDAFVSSQRVSRDLLVVDRAGLQLVFLPDSGGRGTKLSFQVGHPDSCSLRYDPRDEVAKALLKRWGLDVSGRTIGSTSRRRRAVQHVIRG